MVNASKYKCPSCESTIPMDDINVGQNVALCRSCGISCAFSNLVNEEEDDRILASPPKHLTIEKTPQGITMIYRKRGFTAIFVILFAILWTGMIWGVMVPSILQKNPEELLFCIPFIIADVLILCAACFFLFGKSIISASPGKGTYSCGIGIFKISRSFSLTHQTTFGEKIIAQPHGVPYKPMSVHAPMTAMTINNPDEKQVVIGHFISQDAFPCIKTILKQLRK